MAERGQAAPPHSAKRRSSIRPPGPSRQVAFHQLLVAARKTWLADALGDAIGRVDPIELKSELGVYVPDDVQRLLAVAGVRDEQVFPTPVVLETAPTLLGYYRLLLGEPRKSFYAGPTGLGRFQAMERHGTLSGRQKEALPELCQVLGVVLADLVRQLSPAVTARDMGELQLLTLGQQFQGARNVQIGQQAVEEFFLVTAEIVKEHAVERTEWRITLVTASGRRVLIVRASDPDVRIEEEFSGTLRRKVAIEVKGGTDKSNAHNRAGEAEKSHQKAKDQGFRDFWTIFPTKGLDLEAVKRESPTTTSWYDVTQVLGRQGADWKEFRSRLAGEVGIPVE